MFMGYFVKIPFFFEILLDYSLIKIDNKNFKLKKFYFVKLMINKKKIVLY